MGPVDDVTSWGVDVKMSIDTFDGAECASRSGLALVLAYTVRKASQGKGAVSGQPLWLMGSQLGVETLTI